jgi:hypothetical protein
MSNATPPIGYEVKFQRVGVGGGADLQIRSLLDKQQFYDPLGLALAAGISSATWPLFGHHQRATARPERLPRTPAALQAWLTDVGV